eukprot:NODE_4266_length_680_cov_42.646593_g3630_i0.p1 GENE.NODE_4266_length_680_cov_42.646593_g3630_i0~~NODE_4266_length_680_cov_42.646593_g3630_i0.p1  ORF type:complete len:215 (+),score=48.63 NODE_4266_length_680_cov_42.646593_g3630_i0:49-645(+)
MFEKELLIDGRGHLLGRLASIVAKELLRGQRIVVVRCEAINKSGSLFRNKLKYYEFLRKHKNSNHRRGAFHFRTPSRMFWRTVRGMLTHKLARGSIALDKLKVFEGVPYPYDHKKRVVIPDALKVLRMKDHRKFCNLGEIAKLAGWKRTDVVAKLEENRKAKAQKYFELKQKKVVARKKAEGSSEVAKIKEELAKYGF